MAVAMGATQVIAVAGSASHLKLAAKVIVGGERAKASTLHPQAASQQVAALPHVHSLQMGATTVIDRHAKDVVQTIKVCQ